MSEPKYLVWDVESSGTDVFNDRIVQLFVATADEDGNLIDTHEWIINPGIEIPEEASNIHGYTTEFLRENGVEPHRALWEADLIFKEAVRQKLILVAYNANFDMSILTAEMARNALGSGYGVWIADNTAVADALVIDRAKDRYRKGKRKLENLAAHYGVPFDPEKAHDAAYDVEITAKVTAAVIRKYGLPTNGEQAQYYAEWARSYEDWLHSQGKTDIIDTSWPVRKKESA